MENIGSNTNIWQNFCWKGIVNQNSQRRSQRLQYPIGDLVEILLEITLEIVLEIQWFPVAPQTYWVHSTVILDKNR
jgi:hypothetical protein